MIGNDVQRLMKSYPAIFLACHSKHVRDPQTREVVSAHQASILDHLDEIEPMSLKDLAAHMGVTAATMSVTIDRLEAKGYVVRTRAEHDKRMIGLRLTETGARLRDASSVLDQEKVLSMLGRLSEEARATALQGLQILADAASSEMQARAEKKNG